VSKGSAAQTGGLNYGLSARFGTALRSMPRYRIFAIRRDEQLDEEFFSDENRALSVWAQNADLFPTTLDGELGISLEHYASHPAFCRAWSVADIPVREFTLVTLPGAADMGPSR